MHRNSLHTLSNNGPLDHLLMLPTPHAFATVSAFLESSKQLEGVPKSTNKQPRSWLDCDVFCYLQFVHGKLQLSIQLMLHDFCDQLVFQLGMSVSGLDGVMVFENEIQAHLLEVQGQVVVSVLKQQRAVLHVHVALDRVAQVLFQLVKLTGRRVSASNTK